MTFMYLFKDMIYYIISCLQSNYRLRLFDVQFSKGIKYNMVILMRFVDNAFNMKWMTIMGIREFNKALNSFKLLDIESEVILYDQLCRLG